MRLFLLPLFLLGVTCVRIDQQPVLLPEGEDVPWDEGECIYQERSADTREYCPGCQIPDGNPTYPVYHVSEDSERCRPILEWRSCPPVPACSSTDWPTDCQVEWSEWSECDATCGGGQQWRRRNLPLQCMSCRSCDIEYRSCATQPCGRDCVIGDWSDWGPCSVSCLPYAPVSAVQTRTRPMTQGQRPGVLCDPSDATEVRTCSPKPAKCAVNCVVSDWNEWSPCSASCGCGIKHRERKVTTQPNEYGSMCPHLFEEKSCKCHDCPQPCQMSEWSIGQCTGDCYLNYTTENGDRVLEYPQRRRTRYIVQEGKGGEPPCDNPCGLTEVELCKDLPQCKADCELNPWGNWTGECPPCVPYGQQVPVQIRERSIAVQADGGCGCTREERVCDVPWCCDDCEVSPWSEWGPCLPTGACPDNTGTQHRRREILRPPCPRKTCPPLDETRECSRCCPVDCQVSAWAGWLPGAANQCAREKPDGTPGEPITCGPEIGKIKYTRAILQQPNECGIPCPELAKELTCHPPSPCCPVNCTLGPAEFSPCFGCGSNAVRFRKYTILNQEQCGGIPCCPPDGCALFRPDVCENPPPCPQNPCIYSEWGEFGACPHSCRDTEPNYQCAVRFLIHKPDNEDCPANLTDCRECNTDCCPVDCEVGEWTPWSSPQPSCGHQIISRSRMVTRPASCRGTPCPPTIQHNTTFTPCPLDCVVDEWGSWSLCKSCLKEGEVPGVRKRTRAILIQPAHGGDNCPNLVETEDCQVRNCSVDCVVSEWGEWGLCSVGCGDGYQTRSRNITRVPHSGGLACPALTETKYCFQPCHNCVLGPLEYGPCSPTCSNQPDATGYRRVTRNTTPLVQVLPDGTKVPVTMCDFAPTIETCPVPCCPVDCVMSPWTDWGECIDGVWNRTRTIATYPSCGGAACPDCRLEKDVCEYVQPENECEFGEACEEGFAEDRRLG